MKELGAEVAVLLSQLAEKLNDFGLHIALAESCTGGLVAKFLTDMPGSSTFFECGVVSYSNRIKHNILHVDNDTIEKHGVVSSEVACEMAEAIRNLSDADIGIGITGVAGPGPDGNVPEGEIYVALVGEKGRIVRKLSTKTQNERDYNRNFAALNAFQVALEYIETNYCKEGDLNG